MYTNARFLGESTGTDVVLKGINDEDTDVLGHSIFFTRCPQLEATLKRSSDDMLYTGPTFDSVEARKAFLRFVYTGNLNDSKNLTTTTLLQLLDCATEYDVDGLAEAVDEQAMSLLPPSGKKCTPVEIGHLVKFLSHRPTHADMILWFRTNLRTWMRKHDKLSTFWEPFKAHFIPQLVSDCPPAFRFWFHVLSNKEPVYYNDFGSPMLLKSFVLPRVKAREWECHPVKKRIEQLTFSLTPTTAQSFFTICADNPDDATPFYWRGSRVVLKRSKDGAGLFVSHHDQIHYPTTVVSLESMRVQLCDALTGEPRKTDTLDSDDTLEHGSSYGWHVFAGSSVWKDATILEGFYLARVSVC